MLRRILPVILAALLAVSIFADGTYGVSGPLVGVWEQIVLQLISMAEVVGWTLATGFALLFGLKYTMGVRAPREEELEGLDVPEHGIEAYPVEAQRAGGVAD